MRPWPPTPLLARLAALATAPLVVGCASRDSPPASTDSGGDEVAVATNDADVGDAAAGCGLICPDDVEVDAPLAVQVKGRIDQICASPDGCHSGGAPMSLSAGHEFDAMIGVLSTEAPGMLRVAPFDPLRSYVYIKLWCDGGIADGGCMPLGQTRMPSAAQLAQLFHDWIEAGAPTP